MERDLTRWHADMQSLSGQVDGPDGDRSVISRLADLQERIDIAEQPLAGVRQQEPIAPRLSPEATPRSRVRPYRSECRDESLVTNVEMFPY